MEFHVPMRLVYAHENCYGPHDPSVVADVLAEASRMSDTMVKSINKTAAGHGYCFYMEVSGPPERIK
jgi:hypothetical protein